MFQDGWGHSLCITAHTNKPASDLTHKSSICNYHFPCPRGQSYLRGIINYWVRVSCIKQWKLVRWLNLVSPCICEHAEKCHSRSSLQTSAAGKELCYLSSLVEKKRKHFENDLFSLWHFIPIFGSTLLIQREIDA